MTSGGRARHLALGCLVLAVFVVAARATAAGQPGQAGRIPILVSHTGEDPVGQLFVENVRGALKQAPSCAYTEKADEADVILLISTLDPDADKPGRVTTAGWSLVIGKDVKVYLGSGLRLCDKERAQKSAAELAGRVESLLKSRMGQPGYVDRATYEANWDREVDRVAETLPVDSCGVKARSAFKEQMDTYYRLSMVASLHLDVRDVIRSVSANFTPEGDFAGKIQAQVAALTQCQADLAALKKAAGKSAVKKK
jgi:hypothetical protein